MENYTLKKMIPLIILTALIMFGITALAGGTGGKTGLITQFVIGFLMTAGIWLGCVTIVRYLWKRFPWERTPVRHLIYECILITVYVTLYALAIQFSLLYLNGGVSMENPVYEISMTYLITFFITVLHEAVFFYYQWKENFSKSVRLEKANLEATYETLKAQVNPHFLFNSLNNLTSLIDDNPEAVKHIQNMSAFLRYLLSNQQKDLVPIQKEMEMVGNYIEIQRSRFGDALGYRNEVRFKHHSLLVPPLSVQMLVENCIKHNIISMEQPLIITIRSEGEILSVENNKQKKTDEVASTGHGLENIRERYRFFTVRKMEVTETRDAFRVELPLLTLTPG